MFNDSNLTDILSIRGELLHVCAVFTIFSIYHTCIEYDLLLACI